MLVRRAMSSCPASTVNTTSSAMTSARTPALRPAHHTWARLAPTPAITMAPRLATKASSNIHRATNCLQPMMPPAVSKSTDTAQPKSGSSGCPSRHWGSGRRLLRSTRFSGTGTAPDQRGRRVHRVAGELDVQRRAKRGGDGSGCPVVRGGLCMDDPTGRQGAGHAAVEPAEDRGQSLQHERRPVAVKRFTRGSVMPILPIVPPVDAA